MLRRALSQSNSMFCGCFGAARGSANRSVPWRRGSSVASEFVLEIPNSRSVVEHFCTALSFTKNENFVARLALVRDWWLASGLSASLTVCYSSRSTGSLATVSMGESASSGSGARSQPKRMCQDRSREKT